MTERYFEGQPPTAEEISRLIVQAVAAGNLIPIVCVASKTGVGVPELLDAFALCALPPDKIVRKGKLADGTEVEIYSDPAGPIVAEIFKTRIDPFVQRLSYLRVFSGTLKKDDTIHASTVRKPIKIHQPLHVQGNATEPVELAIAGDIVAVAKSEDLHTGTCLGDITLPPIHFPTPMVGLAVTPKTRGDEGKLSGGLHKIVEEDPTLRLDHDQQTKELVMTGMSELHRNCCASASSGATRSRWKPRSPRFPTARRFRPTPKGAIVTRSRPAAEGSLARCIFACTQCPKGAKSRNMPPSAVPLDAQYHYDPARNFLWVDSIVGGTIPNNFLPAIEKGFKERLEKGVIAGFKVQNVAVEVFFGKHHPVDSSEAAFKTAGSMAFRNVFREAPAVTIGADREVARNCTRRQAGGRQ